MNGSEKDEGRAPDTKTTLLGRTSSRVKGRGTGSNRVGRFEALNREEWDDGWDGLAELPPFKTEVRHEESNSILSRNKSPDIPFDRSINSYRGCEHGCPYCYARPTHSFWGLSPGLDFETKLTARVNGAALLEQELAKPNYLPAPIALGANTDPYQPIERTYLLTREILEVLLAAKHPLTIVTKSALVLRDIDLLEQLAAMGLVQVGISITSLDGGLARKMEPRASAPHRRLMALEELNRAGVPTMVMMAPLIPSLNDHELEAIMEEVCARGCSEAYYVLLRLPLEIRDLFREWLEREVPDRASRVISLIQSMRGGKDYEATFGKRMRGEGPYAEMINGRYRLAVKRMGLNKGKVELRTDLFTPPVLRGGQMKLL